jgi:hypothetical protein
MRQFQGRYLLYQSSIPPCRTRQMRRNLLGAEAESWHCGVRGRENAQIGILLATTTFNLSLHMQTCIWFSHMVCTTQSAADIRVLLLRQLLWVAYGTSPCTYVEKIRCCMAPFCVLDRQGPSVPPRYWIISESIAESLHCTADCGMAYAYEASF